MKRTTIILSVICLLSVAFVDSKPTIYKINDNDKLEPGGQVLESNIEEFLEEIIVMVPVSSTVIPLPVYKVSASLGVGGKEHKAGKPNEPTKLITAFKKKSTPTDGADEIINIKQISKEEYEVQP